MSFERRTSLLDFARIAGARVGLITNVSGRARDGARTIDLLRNAKGVELVTLFAPEHGLAADREGRIGFATDELSGLPVQSLYGGVFAPTPRMLAGIDTLIVDLQDAGARFFTYASTMHRALEVAKENDLRFIVLDRPNPINAMDVAGPVLSLKTSTFVNHHPLPVRHGMTLGELAEMIDADEHLGARLEVVRMRGFRRGSYFDETGLPWVNPSPNLRSVRAAVLYPGVALLEGTNLSVGRGTETPFEILGAPFVDGDALAAALSNLALGGVSFAATSLVPQAGAYEG
jgi:uncharacterized protein YbbC (DUF1343 family)